MNHLNHHSQDTSHAVVVGGSVAGLLTARVLTNFFGTVTVIERDSLPPTDRPFAKARPKLDMGTGY